MTESSKPRKRLTKEDSTILCKAVQQHKGKWDSIMADKNVKKLKIDLKFAQSHVANKKKKIKKVASKELLDVDKGTFLFLQLP